MDHVLSSLALSLGSHYRVHYSEKSEATSGTAQSKGQTDAGPFFSLATQSGGFLVLLSFPASRISKNTGSNGGS